MMSEVERALREKYRSQGWIKTNELPHRYEGIEEEKLYRMYRSLEKEYQAGCPRMNKSLVVRLMHHIERDLSARSIQRIAKRFHAEVQWGSAYQKGAL